MTRLRYSVFTEDAESSSTVLHSETARDTQEAVDSKVSGKIVEVIGYVASGSTATVVGLNWSNPAVLPKAVMVVRAQNTVDLSAHVTVQSPCTFYLGPNTIAVTEPSGLTANTAYNLTFLILE